MQSKLIKSIVYFLLVFLYLIMYSCAPRSIDGEKPKKPNIIYIMLDEVGYYEPSYMGNKKLLTPNIDKMANEGMVFTNAYSGASVCAPTRVCLMTGKHMGHTSMRSNSGGMPIRADEETVASLLRKAGYATGGFGKWGCGNRGTSGTPESHGFDEFFGYYDQVHAHSFYPEYLIRNGEEVPLEGNPGDYYRGATHAQEEIFKASVQFISNHAAGPFFCYLPWTPPHGLWGISEQNPSYQLFLDKGWNVEGSWRKDDGIRYAALLHMADHQIGEIFSLLKDLKIDDNTLVFFCGDNGGADYFASDQHPRGLFAPNVNPETGVAFRGKKGTVYEGGLKVPMVVRYPGVIKSKSKSDLVWYFPDFMKTVADLVDVQAPKDCDGISILPTLFDQGRQQQHEYLFWMAKNKHALRSGDWKAYATRQSSGDLTDWELYDLQSDPQESTNLAASQVKVVSKLEKNMLDAFSEMRGGEIYDQALYEKDHKINGPKPPRSK